MQTAQMQNEKKIPEKSLTPKKDEKNCKELSILHRELFDELYFTQKEKHTLYESKYLS